MIEKDIIEKLKTVKDPEIGIDVWTLGLIYKITIEDDGVEILMTLTSPLCPFADQLIQEVEESIASLGVDARVEITFTPAWEASKELRDMMGV